MITSCHDLNSVIFFFRSPAFIPTGKCTSHKEAISIIPLPLSLFSREGACIPSIILLNPTPSLSFHLQAVRFPRRWTHASLFSSPKFHQPVGFSLQTDLSIPASSSFKMNDSGAVLNTEDPDITTKQNYNSRAVIPSLG